MQTAKNDSHFFDTKLAKFLIVYYSASSTMTPAE